MSHSRALPRTSHHFFACCSESVDESITLLCIYMWQIYMAYMPQTPILLWLDAGIFWPMCHQTICAGGWGGRQLCRRDRWSRDCQAWVNIWCCSAAGFTHNALQQSFLSADLWFGPGLCLWGSGGSDMIGLLCALKCNIGAIQYCVSGHWGWGGVGSILHKCNTCTLQHLHTGQ